MTLLGRLSNIINGRVNSTLDRMEDPSEMMDLSYEQLLKELQNAKVQLGNITANRIGLDNQISDCNKKIAEYTDDATVAVKNNKDDLAKIFLQKKSDETTKMNTYQETRDKVLDQENKIKDFVNRLAQKVENFAVEKELEKTKINAAKAEISATKNIAGLGSGLSSASDVMERARNKSAALQAQAEATDSICGSGLLADSNSPEAQIAALKSNSDVDSELEALKQKVNQ
jgi:phage shock protein A